ncbi:MAG TPA: chemotaxis protein CheB, partial [Labilithrix sp.]|nr:chemotaxis protein CheB [Labilithrix sp.]
MPVRKKKPPPPAPKPFPIVGVGASAGGLEAFKQLLEALPAEPGMALVLIQHLDPTHTSLLGAALAPSSKM